MPVAASDPFVLLYTSGTTAAPKGVPHPYQTYLSNFRLAARELGIGPHDVLLCAAPFTHLYGLSALSVALCAGATAVLLPTYTPQEFADLLVHERPSVVYAGPAHIASCLGSALLDGKDCSSVRLVVLSGAAVPPDLAQALEAKLGGGKVLQLWGMTELQAGAYGRPGDAPTERVGAAGRAAPATSFGWCAMTASLPPRAWWVSSRCAAHRSSPATSTIPGRPRRRSPPTAGSAPATSRRSTRPATCALPDGRRRSSTAAA
ncbi:MAG: AMP-binding protein [Burkholderiales bacterium]|nr:AMP-binding protein [Burkholderiales bacterium]